MKYQRTRTVGYYGATLKFTATFSLDDDCKNGVCDFSITGDAICTVGKQGICKKGDYIYGGCCHDEITKYFPELVPFIPLHLSNEFGQPMYPVDNFIYHINQRESDEKLCGWYRVTKEQLAVLRESVIDKGFFQYQLMKLGVIDQWRKEAEKAIAWLEEKTGQTFTHTENPKHTLPNSEAFEAMEQRVLAGEFTSTAIQDKMKAEHKAWQDEKIAEINKEYEQSCEFINRKHELALWCVENAPTQNYSFWAYNGFGYENKPKFQLKLNAYSWKSKITEEEYQAFLERTSIPDGLEVILEKS